MNTAIVMITCQKFSQAWDPFFILLKKYWPDCPYKIYMITDFGQYNDDIVETITIGSDLGFSSNLIYGLNKISEDIILYFQEDYLFTDYFDTKKIILFEKYLRENSDVGCLRLAPCPGPTSPSNHKDLGILQIGDAYRVSTQTALWKKNVLLSLLVPKEGGADFEIKGTKRSYDLPYIFLSVWREQSPTPYFITAIVRGIWQDGALELLEKEKISTEKITRIIK